MTKNIFRTLRADEIEIRPGSGNCMLLYKNARVDQNILDETVGQFGWKPYYTRIDGKLYCTLSIRDPESGEWISKQDVGTPSKIEGEKGEVSDALKRAAFCFGIGRELYSSPKIEIPRNLQIGKLSVREIDYDENRKIVKLVIVNGKGQVAFTYLEENKQISQVAAAPENTDQKIDADQIKELIAEVCRTGTSMPSLLTYCKVARVEDISQGYYTVVMKELAQRQTKAS